MSSDSSDRGGRVRPPVSVVMPVLNEERHLRAAVGRVLAQDYPAALEVVLALGPSRDRTDEIAHELGAADLRVRLVRNPSGRTRRGSTRRPPRPGTRSSRGSTATRYHRPTTCARRSRCSRTTGADNVGGVMAAHGETPFEQAVARAMRSRLGVGNAAFHTGGSAGPAPTVYLGVFRRRTLDRLGGYDESFVRAQDWELNYRIRQAGGLVWFSPALEVVYRPRSTLQALARQYFDYGRWRRAISRRYPESINARYLAPPGDAARGAGRRTARRRQQADRPRAPRGVRVTVVAGAGWTGYGLPSRAWVQLPLVYATMHFAWAAGFLTSPRELASGRTVPRPAPAVSTGATNGVP